MATTTTTLNKPVWVDLAATDAGAERDYYAKLFGWQVEVTPTHSTAATAWRRSMGRRRRHRSEAAPDAPTAWSLYSGRTTSTTSAKRIEGAGGTVVAPPFDVGDQGRMAVFQDLSGAFFSAWQGTRMRGFRTQARTATAGPS